MIIDNFILLDSDGQEVSEGAVFKNADGKEYVVVGGRPPHKPSSTGRIFVKIASIVDDCFTLEFFPTVLNLKWHQLKYVFNGLVLSQTDGSLVYGGMGVWLEGSTVYVVDAYYGENDTNYVTVRFPDNSYRNVYPEDLGFIWLEEE